MESSMNPSQNNLKAFQLGFDSDGRLHSTWTGSFFEYNATGDKRKDAERYSAVGDAVAEEIYRRMEILGLQRVPCSPPIKVSGALLPNEQVVQSFFFASWNAANADRLLILIHGSGAVRAGMWSRRLAINEGLKEGSQLPYIERALQEGYGVIVLNTNFNSVDIEVRRSSGFLSSQGSSLEYKHFVFRNNETPERHAHQVWTQCVRRAQARQIAIVAHSYGGHVTLKLAASFPEEFKRRVSAICLTDSAHSSSDVSSLPFSVRSHVQQVTVDWVASYLPVDTPMQGSSGLTYVSSGHNQHEWTSHTAFESVFRFIRSRFSSSGFQNGQQYSQNAFSPTWQQHHGSNSRLFQLMPTTPLPSGRIKNAASKEQKNLARKEKKFAQKHSTFV